MSDSGERSYRCPSQPCPGLITLNREGYALVPCKVCGHDPTAPPPPTWEWPFYE